MIRLLFSVIGICLSIHLSYGIDIDSLERKVEILNRYNASYTKGDKKHTLNRFRSALNIARDIKYRNGIATAHSNLANFYFQNKSVDSAIFHYNKALQIYLEETNDKKTGESLYNIGFVHYLKGNIEKEPGVKKIKFEDFDFYIFWEKGHQKITDHKNNCP